MHSFPFEPLKTEVTRLPVAILYSLRFDGPIIRAKNCFQVKSAHALSFSQALEFLQSSPEQIAFCSKSAAESRL